MTIRNLDAIFHPRGIALIGASARAGSVGLVTAVNLKGGGFTGSLAFVNPKPQEILGAACYADIASVPFVPDLGVICTPPRAVPQVIAELGARGAKGAIVITAGFGELEGGEGHALQQAMLDAARPHLLRIIGPNCLGVVSTPAGLNGSFAPRNAKKGGIAFVAQSGAIVTTVLDWATSRGIGFSHLVSLGDMADVDFGDMLDYLANDQQTSAILLYIEAVTSARKFISAARAAARLKPVIAIKAGRHGAAAKAAHSHTGALAGIDSVYDAAFRRAGILRVRDLEEIFDAVETLSIAPRINRDDMVILTNGGGAGVLAIDALLDFGGVAAELSPDTIKKLDALLPTTWSKGNPVDIIGDAPAARYAASLETLLEAPETNAVLVINCPTAIASSTEAARAVIEVARPQAKAVLANWLGGDLAQESRALFAAAALPSYETPTEAARGFMHLMHYRKGQEAIVEVPSSAATEFSPDSGAARAVIDRALELGQGWLAPEDVSRLFECYRIPMVRAAKAPDIETAVKLAAKFGGAVALKIVSPDILHKSEVGGVALGLKTKDAVRAAATAMLAQVKKTQSSARLDGFLVQEMVEKPGAYELIAGMAVDAQFGPFLLFGQGGTAVEIVADRAVALPPLNLRLARELIEETRIARLLKGYRDHPPANLPELASTLVKLSQLVCDFDEVVEIDLNPLLLDATSIVAVDARVRIAPLKGARGARLSIRPYPKELERDEQLSSLGRLKLRPIRPEDAEALKTLVAELSPEDARLRFFLPLKSVQPQLLARFTQIDYDREMALVLYRPEGGRFAGVVRLIADPDNVSAEFAIVVASDLHRQGIGRLLMTRLVEYARARGLSELMGHVLRENSAMLALAAKLGFQASAGESPDVVRVSLRLAAPS
ncbi:MAG TPA: bifunctional acetate--CoA ligase family protein/GNAT family N-acetyltransferase [Micropepsaceae bacterium]|nr:bifunctional acetate--CoA ligase family protein/GNAT family N-acetyltransferase [Micropepsaceae bacterium]